MFEGTKRLLAMLLACTLALGTLTPMTAYAEELGAAPEEKPDAFIDPVEEEGTDCSLDHTWDDADCDTPKTCSVCGATEGDALGHTWADADCDTPKTCSVCGATEGDALGHTWADADCDTPKTCSVCGATEGDALGHSWQEAETVKVCTVCGTEEKIQTQQPEDGENDILIIADEADLKVESYSAFLKELKVLEGYADAFAAGNSKYSDPNVLVVNFIRTGVERYQTVYWSGLAGSEITAFTEYVRQQDAANGTTAMALRNIVIEDFKLPNGNPADFGHMSGTMNILYCNNSQNSHDIGGWAGDICDLLLYSRDHGDVPEGTVDEMAAFILEKCFGVDADDAFGWDDFYGDLDAYYLVREWKKGGKSLSGLMEEYFTADLDDQDRSAYFLNHRFTGLKTQQDVRDAVYHAYIGNTAIEILEGDSDRNLTDVNPDLRKAACYAFADYVYTQAGDRLGEDTGEEPDPEIPTDPSEPEEEPENPYYEDFSVSKSFLAPGISQSIHYALSADNKQMAYYVATVDVTRDDVTIMANYRNADPTQGWGMSRVMDQAEALTAKHSNPEDAPNYIENFSVVVATNGDGYNMSTGEPGGLLVMGGVEYHPVDKDGFFAILKDGSAMIGTRADYDIYKDQIQEAIGGFGATLVKDGKIVANPADTTRASRTAVGITATGAVVMMVLDGRQEPFSCGGSMAEIAQIMYEAGCVHAINLDGGGSTTYASKPEGADKLQLVNRPSDGYARSVAATLAAISTSKVTNEFDHANISADYDYLTIGTSVTVTAVGVSTSGNAAPIPEDAQWVVSDETIGTITQEGVFTAVENGEVEVSLIQGEKVLGSKTLHVVVPNGIAFAKERMNIIFDTPIQMPVQVYYNENPVAYNDEDIMFGLSVETAGTFSGSVFTASGEEGIRNCFVAVILAKIDEDIGAMMELAMYKDGEAVFDFDDITGGTRELAWKRGISNSTTQDSVIYNIDDPTKPMDITYVFGLDMETIEFPEKLEEIRYMLGGEAGSTAWDYMLMFAERISVLTEVVISARFDKNLVIDYSDLSFRNDYFNLTSATLDEETNTLTIKCNWVDQTQAIDPATANPTCILSGIKATPKEGGWDELGQMNIINSGSIGYDVYARFSSLYSFACKEENQEKYGLYPYSVQTDEISYNGGPEQGGHFSSTYAEFEDHFTLDKSMRQGWYSIDDQMFYFVDHVALTGIQYVPSYEDPSVKLFYDFGEDGACTGKVTGLIDYDGGKCYAVLGKMMTGWQSMYDRDGNAIDYYFDRTTGKAVNGVQTIAGYTYTFEDYVLVRGDLVTDETGTRYRWAGQWVYGKWFEVDGNLYHTARYETYVTTGFKHIVGQDLEYHWHLFDENGVFQKDYTGKYDVGEDSYYLENGIMIQEPGLIILDGYYYYFCSTGKAVKNCTYWPTKTNGLLPMGPYVFDAEGRITNVPGQTPDVPDQPDTPDTPDEPAEKKNGIHTINGKLYYYVDDVIQYAAGIVQLEDGTYIYVRSNGQLAVGTYWVTNTNGLMDQGMHNFDDSGIMTDPPVAEPEEPDVPVDPDPDQPDTPVEPEKPEVKEGIIEENGVLYYYENGIRAYAKGLVKLEDGSYIYVRSNGQLAIGSYWVTNDNGLLPQQLYSFGEDGKMLNPPVTEPEDPDTPDQPDTPVVPEQPAVKHGIVEENGVLYYYENGTRAYAKGVVKLVDEAGVTYYIYVRSNAQLALGNYWTTNHNGLLAEKMYNFGTDGRYYPA